MDRIKTIYGILGDYWKSIKPYVDNIPTDDSEWDAFVRINTKLTNKYNSLPYEERQFAREISLACLNYIQNRSRDNECKND